MESAIQDNWIENEKNTTTLNVARMIGRNRFVFLYFLLISGITVKLNHIILNISVPVCLKIVAAISQNKICG